MRALPLPGLLWIKSGAGREEAGGWGEQGRWGSVCSGPEPRVQAPGGAAGGHSQRGPAPGLLSPRPQSHPPVPRDEAEVLQCEWECGLPKARLHT